MNEELNFEAKALLSELYKILNLPVLIEKLEESENDANNEKD